MWIQLLAGSGEYKLTTHREFAWITGFHRAEEVVRDLNRDPEWNTITYNIGNLKSDPIPVIYSMVEFMEYKWQPMDNAPVHRPILTDVGIVCHVDQAVWDSPVTTGWYLCDPDSDILSCAEERMLISLVSPKLWMDLPPKARR